MNFQTDKMKKNKKMLNSHDLNYKLNNNTVSNNKLQYISTTYYKINKFIQNLLIKDKIFKYSTIYKKFVSVNKKKNLNNILNDLIEINKLIFEREKRLKFLYKNKNYSSQIDLKKKDSKKEVSTQTNFFQNSTKEFKSNKFLIEELITFGEINFKNNKTKDTKKKEKNSSYFVYNKKKLNYT